MSSYGWGDVFTKMKLRTLVAKPNKNTTQNRPSIAAKCCLIADVWQQVTKTSSLHENISGENDLNSNRKKKIEINYTRSHFAYVKLHIHIICCRKEENNRYVVCVCVCTGVLGVKHKYKLGWLDSDSDMNRRQFNWIFSFVSLARNGGFFQLQRTKKRRMRR